MPYPRQTAGPARRFFFTVAPSTPHEADTLIGRADALCGAAEQARRRFPFFVDGWVVLPDHMHCLWTLPPGDADWLRRWRLLEAVYPGAPPRGSAAAVRSESNGATALRRWLLWTVELEDPASVEAHLAYLRDNPVRHGYVERPEDWPFSSFHGRARRRQTRRERAA